MLAVRDKLAALGQLAAGVAHEINNPAMYVLTNLEFVRSALVERDPTGKDDSAGDLIGAIDDAIDGVRRIRRTVADLGVLSRGAESVLESVDINHLVRAAANMAVSDLRARARLELHLGEVPRFAGNSSRLTQVVLNLLLNAAQACGEGNPDKHLVRVTTRVDGSNVVLEVRDDGCGIPPEHRPHLFEPFFTTRPAGQGTGLGLAVTRGIVRKYGGTITFSTEVGVGTTWRITLPLKEVVPRDDEEESPVSRTSRRDTRVLVIDDEPLVLRALDRVLSDKSQLQLAESGEQALDLLSDTSAEFDVIVCDLLLPGMTGADVYHHVQEQRPDLAARMVFLTGGPVSAQLREFVQAQAHRVLHKPVGYLQLRTAIGLIADGVSVRTALERTRRGSVDVAPSSGEIP
jgi:CheY-like chemotaxis protein